MTLINTLLFRQIIRNAGVFGDTIAELNTLVTISWGRRYRFGKTVA